MIKLTLAQATQEMGCSIETLRRQLRKIGLPTGRACQYTIAEIFRAVTGGDMAAEKLRRERAEADLAELEVHEKRRTLIPREECAEFIIATFGPVREQMLGMPGQMAPLVNPSDPEHARAQLQVFADNFMRHCREKVPKEEVVPDVEAVEEEALDAE